MFMPYAINETVMSTCIRTFNDQYIDGIQKNITGIQEFILTEFSKNITGIQEFRNLEKYYANYGP